MSRLFHFKTTYFPSVIACLPKLSSLQISHNKLTDAESLEHLVDCEYLSVVDLSHNKIDDPNIVDVFARMKTLVSTFVIDHKAGEIIRLVASVLPSVCPSMLSHLNRLTHDLYYLHEGWPWPWLGWYCRSRSNSDETCFTWHFVVFQPVLRSRSKVRGQGQSSRSRSKVVVKMFKMSFFYWHGLVDSGTWLC